MKGWQWPDRETWQHYALTTWWPSTVIRQWVTWQEDLPRFYLPFLQHVGNHVSDVHRQHGHCATHVSHCFRWWPVREREREREGGGCVCVRACACALCPGIHACVHVCVCTHMHACVHIHVFMCACVHMQECVYVCVYAYMCMCVYVRVCVCVCVCVCVRAMCMHTYNIQCNQYVNLWYFWLLLRFNIHPKPWPLFFLILS